jgi:endonuclease YncB( thermonuclease family)
MRPVVLIASAVALALLAAFVFIGGRDAVRQSTVMLPTPPVPAAVNEPRPPAEKIAPRRSPAASRQVAPSIVAPPGLEPDRLQWAAPREPLSELSLALPPKPQAPKPLLFRPVAEAAGVIAADGRTITIDGVELIGSDEVCAGRSGKDWPCGRAARTAFRAFLRGRAVTCDFPVGEVPKELTASCRLGKRDVGAWLVVNGWARAAPGGPYADAGKSAQSGGKGVFGPGPDLSGPAAADVTAATPPVARPEPAQ